MKIKSIVEGEKYRFTVLTSKLIRMEYSERGIFENNKTQRIFNRNFEETFFKVIETDESLEIITKDISLYYKKGEFNKNNLYIQMKNGVTSYKNKWYFGDYIETLKGTCRTLDAADGAVEIEEGIISKNGFSIIDDSNSLIINEEGWIEERDSNEIDIYFFAYGRDYFECLKDFYSLTGNTPILPRYVFGNWWSRFWKYDEEELKNLMKTFRHEKIPFSVCVIDMDWHITEVPAKYGSGWTGYTWNKKLFTDPKKFIKWLHDNGQKVTLNIHPADGVRGYEEAYLDMAKELNVNYENEDQIHFDIGNKEFLNAYFKYLHRPREDEGIDFWWIDWQQGVNSGIKDLDPLWMLNHFHTQDMLNRNKRALIFSRYAGIGSHRYPIGFSGDTVISWESYAFQPYFTATASNIGYTWWSHDIGGHFKGIKDDELALRWVQFGVFSPIMRLHSSCSPFTSKEPWRYSLEYCERIKEFLRLRHKMVPYLYSMNYQTAKYSKPLVTPMYYFYPELEEAYNVPNQYMFGSELMVCSITEKTSKETRFAKTTAYIPKGMWIDIFTKKIYEGEGVVNLYRDINSQPVLAKQGAIIPFAKNIENDILKQTDIEVFIFIGENNSFDLYEDDGITIKHKRGAFAITKFELIQNGDVRFKINRTVGDLNIVEKTREITLNFMGIQEVKEFIILENNLHKNYEKKYLKDEATLKIILDNCHVDDEIEIIFKETLKLKRKNIEMEVYEALNIMQIEYEVKDKIYQLAKTKKEVFKILRELQTMNLSDDIYGVISEILLSY